MTTQLPMTPGQMPKPPSREQVEEQCVIWAYHARQAMNRKDLKAASQLGEVLETALAGYAAMYGAEPAEQLRRAMARAGQRADSTGRALETSRRTRRLMYVLAALGLVAAILFAWLGRARGAEPDPDRGRVQQDPTPEKPRKKPKGKPRPEPEQKPEEITCAAGQTSSYDPETGTHSCRTQCPKGQSVVVTNGRAACGCPGGQVYNIRSEACETPN